MPEWMKNQTDRNDLLKYGNLKISKELMMAPRLRASPRHGGAGGISKLFLVIDPPRGRPVGGGGVDRIRGVRVDKIIIGLIRFSSP
jgi:hypothetical protein